MKRKLTLKSSIKFKKKIVLSFHRLEYYKAMQDNLTNHEQRELEKKRLHTTRKARVEALIEVYKKKGEVMLKGTEKILKQIYHWNYKEAIRKKWDKTIPIIKTKKLHRLICNPTFLMLAYRSIKSNKGALTEAYVMSAHKKKRLTPRQLSYVERTYKAPDGMRYEIFEITADLLKEGKYPWGTSKRIYMDKPAAEQPSFGPAPLPGTDKKRPITIPPFMDRVVQAAILMVLESVYEPSFDYENVSFGFRKHKGCHDAIYSLTRNYTTTMNMAIEGDIKAAYDNVERPTLLKILGLRIEDRKFLNLIKQRLDVEIYDTEKKTWLKEKKGIPQGGIDSPYLWNIYMQQFDTWIKDHLTQYFEKMNKKTERKKYSPATNMFAPTTKKLNNEKLRTTRALNKGNLEKEEVFTLIKKLKLINHKRRQLAFTDPNKRPCKFVYSRYADDWIILFTGNKLHAKVIKEQIQKWLETELQVTLSVEKTLVTNMGKEHSKFLGFELFNQKHQKLGWKDVSSQLKGGIERGKKSVLCKVTKTTINIGVDKQRLLNRLHMKGYCDKKGYPIAIPWLAMLDPHIIIERYNSVIRGLSNYYVGMLSNPSQINRWIYILRYSCFKTLCNKYKTSISKLYKKYGSRDKKNGKNH
jgi:retron-type reverse transcriptase